MGGAGLPPRLGSMDLLLQADADVSRAGPLQGQLLGSDYGRAGPWTGPEPCQASGFPDSKLL